MPDNNPWDVDSIKAFSCFKCPECVFYSKHNNEFQDHALDNHPLSFVLFSKSFKEDELNKNSSKEYNEIDLFETNDKLSLKQVHEGSTIELTRKSSEFDRISTTEGNEINMSDYVIDGSDEISDKLSLKSSDIKENIVKVDFEEPRSLDEDLKFNFEGIKKEVLHDVDENEHNRFNEKLHKCRYCKVTYLLKELYAVMNDWNIRKSTKNQSESNIFVLNVI